MHGHVRKRGPRSVAERPEKTDRPSNAATKRGVAIVGPIVWGENGPIPTPETPKAETNIAMIPNRPGLRVMRHPLPWMSTALL